MRSLWVDEVNDSEGVGWSHAEDSQLQKRDSVGDVCA